MSRNIFYRISDTVEATDRWWLKSPCDNNGNPVDPELFRVARKLEVAQPLTISIRYEGQPLDFTFADFEMPVVSKRTATLLRNICPEDFDFFQARVETQAGDFEVINFRKKFPCLDEDSSEVMYWGKDDGRLDKIGQYRQVINPRINSSRVRDANIFRIAGWEIALIASEKVRLAFEKEKITGVRFIEVG